MLNHNHELVCFSNNFIPRHFSLSCCFLALSCMYCLFSGGRHSRALCLSRLWAHLPGSRPRAASLSCVGPPSGITAVWCVSSVGPHSRITAARCVSLVCGPIFRDHGRVMCLFCGPAFPDHGRVLCFSRLWVRIMALPLSHSCRRYVWTSPLAASWRCCHCPWASAHVCVFSLVVLDLSIVTRRPYDTDPRFWNSMGSCFQPSLGWTICLPGPIFSQAAQLWA